MRPDGRVQQLVGVSYQLPAVAASPRTGVDGRDQAASEVSGADFIDGALVTGGKCLGHGSMERLCGGDEELLLGLELCSGEKCGLGAELDHCVREHFLPLYDEPGAQESKLVAQRFGKL